MSSLCSIALATGLSSACVIKNGRGQAVVAGKWVGLDFARCGLQLALQIELGLRRLSVNLLPCWRSADLHFQI